MLICCLVLGVFVGGMVVLVLVFFGLRFGLIEFVYVLDLLCNFLDIYWFEGVGFFFVILDIYGGGFISGDKCQFVVFWQILVKGIVVVWMNYCLLDQVCWFVQQDDVLVVVVFLQICVVEFGL